MGTGGDEIATDSRRQIPLGGFRQLRASFHRGDQMGVRGTKPTPTVLKILRGNPGRRRLNTQEPTPAPADPQRPPPDWLDDAAKTEWARVAPMLARNGLLTEMDLDALTCYCQAWCTWKAASEQIRKFGMVIKARNGFPMQSPYVSIANKAMVMMKGLMMEFGMTPSSRSHVSRDVEVRPANVLDRFVHRTRG
jgi:P27 family predicted phage terminase small subunit